MSYPRPYRQIRSKQRSVEANNSTRQSRALQLLFSLRNLATSNTSSDNIKSKPTIVKEIWSTFRPALPPWATLFVGQIHNCLQLFALAFWFRKEGIVAESTKGIKSLFGSYHSSSHSSSLVLHTTLYVRMKDPHEFLMS